MMADNNNVKNKGDIDVWIKQAVRDMQSAENSLKSGDYYVAALLSQQAVEKALKYLYITRKKKLLPIHDLTALAKLVGAPQDILFKCSEINPVYIEVRYPSGKDLPSEKIDERQAKHILTITYGILIWVKEQV